MFTEFEVQLNTYSQISTIGFFHAYIRRSKRLNLTSNSFSSDYALFWIKGLKYGQKTTQSFQDLTKVKRTSFHLEFIIKRPTAIIMSSTSHDCIKHTEKVSDTGTLKFVNDVFQLISAKYRTIVNLVCIIFYSQTVRCRNCTVYLFKVWKTREFPHLTDSKALNVLIESYIFESESYL